MEKQERLRKKESMGSHGPQGLFFQEPCFHAISHVTTSLYAVRVQSNNATCPSRVIFAKILLPRVSWVNQPLSYTDTHTHTPLSLFEALSINVDFHFPFPFPFPFSRDFNLALFFRSSTRSCFHLSPIQEGS